MVKYLMVTFVLEKTQQELIRIFMLVSTDFYFNKYILNNGIAVKRIQEVEWRQWMSAPENMKITILTGKEVFK